MTREEVVEIMNYCKEHKMTYKSRLEELNIPVWRFYDSKSRYAAEQSSGKSAQGKHSKKCTFYTLRFGCSFAAVNTIKPQLL